jgi:Ser/Thr protein kinase RdoA (MazF antagonist)
LVTWVAEAAAKLHDHPLPAMRRHTIDDELRILHERLAQISARHPEWAARIAQIAHQAAVLARSLPTPHQRSIHRDFYPDQLLVAGDRLYLVDLDLLANGDPALDIGNFIGHMIEYSLRHSGDPMALAASEAILSQRYQQLVRPVGAREIEAYTTLTLARHIALSDQFEERRHCTEALLDLTEQRLAMAA